MDKKKGKTNSQGQRFWNAHINAQACSGLTGTEYCRQHHLSYWAFGYWKRKTKQQKAPVNFIPVQVKKEDPLSPSIAPSAALRLSIGKYGIEVPCNFSPETLEQLLDIVEARR